MNEHHEFRPAQRPDKRSDRPEGRFEARTDGKPERPRRSLRETVCDIDRDILRMLMRRHNLIKRMYNAKGFLEPAEEKSIRESWEAAVSRVSRDPRLSGRFFTLMQEAEFLPRPGEDGEAQRPAFNLAPADMPARLPPDPGLGHAGRLYRPGRAHRPRPDERSRGGLRQAAQPAGRPCQP